MKASELLSVLDEQDRENKLWLFTPADLRVLFPRESDNSLKKSIQRHVRSGVLKLVKKGLYANPRARSVPAEKLAAVASYLKPDNLNYVSQESRLSELGRISQMPLDYVTMMTRGNSQTFKTCYGTIEFTKTRQPLDYILAHTNKDPSTGLLVADEELALRDLKHARRNLDLVVKA